VLQPRGKQQQGSGAHAHHDLIGVLAGQLADGRADDARLGPWIVKGDAVRPFGRADVVRTAEEVVGMVVHGVRGARRVHVGPTTGYLEALVTELQKFQGSRGHVPDHGDQLAERVALM
jgi:hypothetical protein